MRDRRSPDEAAAIERMRCALTSSGHVVSDDIEITDRPDWVFEFDGRRVAAECTCVNLPQLMKWAGYRDRRYDGKHYEVRFAYEPHLWVKTAIESKSAKIGGYKHRAQCEEIWLVMHSEVTALPLFGCSSATLALMRAAAAATVSGFDAVWFVHAEAGANLLWQTGDPHCAFPELDVSRGYPTLWTRQGVVTLKAGGGEFSLGPHNAAVSLTIQPLDRRFKL